MRKVSIITTDYNIKHLDEVLEKCDDLFNKTYHYEIVFVCTNADFQNYTSAHNIKFLQMPTNTIYNEKIACGLNHSEGACTIIADFKDPNWLEYISSMLKEWENGANIVRLKKHRKDFLGVLALKDWIKNKFMELFGFKADRKCFNTFELYSHDVVEVLKADLSSSAYNRATNRWIDYKDVVLRVKNNPKRKMTWAQKDIYYWLGIGLLSIFIVFSAIMFGSMSVAMTPANYKTYWVVSVGGSAILLVFGLLFMALCYLRNKYLCNNYSEILYETRLAGNPQLDADLLKEYPQQYATQNFVVGDELRTTVINFGKKRKNELDYRTINQNQRRSDYAWEYLDEYLKSRGLITATNMEAQQYDYTPEVQQNTDYGNVDLLPGTRFKSEEELLQEQMEAQQREYMENGQYVGEDGQYVFNQSPEQFAEQGESAEQNYQAEGLEQEQPTEQAEQMQSDEQVENQEQPISNATNRPTINLGSLIRKGQKGSKHINRTVAQPMQEQEEAEDFAEQPVELEQGYVQEQTNEYENRPMPIHLPRGLRRSDSKRRGKPRLFVGFGGEIIAGAGSQAFEKEEFEEELATSKRSRKQRTKKTTKAVCDEAKGIMPKGKPERDGLFWLGTNELNRRRNNEKEKADEVIDKINEALKGLKLIHQQKEMLQIDNLSSIKKSKKKGKQTTDKGKGTLPASQEVQAKKSSDVDMREVEVSEKEAEEYKSQFGDFDAEEFELVHLKSGQLKLKKRKRRKEERKLTTHAFNKILKKEEDEKSNREKQREREEKRAETQKITNAKKSPTVKETSSKDGGKKATSKKTTTSKEDTKKNAAKKPTTKKTAAKKPTAKKVNNKKKGKKRPIIRDYNDWGVE